MFLPSHAVPFTNYCSRQVELVPNVDLLGEDPRPDLERMHEANRQDEASLAAAILGHANDDFPLEGKVSSLLMRYHRNSNEVVISQKVFLLLLQCMCRWVRLIAVPVWAPSTLGRTVGSALQKPSDLSSMYAGSLCFI